MFRFVHEDGHELSPRSQGRSLPAVRVASESGEHDLLRSAFQVAAPQLQVQVQDEREHIFLERFRSAGGTGTHHHVRLSSGDLPVDDDAIGRGRKNLERNSNVVFVSNPLAVLAKLVLSASAAIHAGKQTLRADDLQVQALLLLGIVGGDATGNFEK